ncbi:TPA: ABC-three component system middle component 7 [Vibrio alginolyticus]
MILPNKSIPFKKTVLYKMLSILELDFNEVPISDLYKRTSKRFDGIDEFVYAIDLLYVLDKISINEFGLVKKC